MNSVINCGPGSGLATANSYGSYCVWFRNTGHSITISPIGRTPYGNLSSIRRTKHENLAYLTKTTWQSLLTNRRRTHRSIKAWSSSTNSCSGLLLACSLIRWRLSKIAIKFPILNFYKGNCCLVTLPASTCTQQCFACPPLIFSHLPITIRSHWYAGAFHHLGRDKFENIRIF